MKNNGIILGFSKLSKEEKIELITQHLENPAEVKQELKYFWLSDSIKQKLLDEFSENTISNFFFPYSVAPNFNIDGKNYVIPMVTEESSVVAAAANSAKFWAKHGGFHTEIISTTKNGHVHFIWEGNPEKLKAKIPELKELFLKGTQDITRNMRARGGGITDIKIIDLNHKIDNYYKIRVEFETVDSMGANFINSCLEEIAILFRKYILESDDFQGNEKDVKIIMSILSNYTPECLVKVWVESDIDAFAEIDSDLTAEEFVWKFEKAVQIATVDTFRATTHNKGIFNGIDAVVLATGNDFRAVEACGHAYASRKGQYSSLTEIEIKNNHFKYSLTIPLSLGTIGGLTSLHPMARCSLKLLGNPNAYELMRIAAAAGLANNFGAIKSLVTNGIQKGHMKMHLMNILNQLEANESEKNTALDYFKQHKVSFNLVSEFLYNSRKVDDSAN